MAEGEYRRPTYDNLLELCTRALADEHGTENDEPDQLEYCRTDARIILDELVDSLALFTADRWDELCHSCEQRTGEHTLEGAHPHVRPEWGEWTEPDSDVVDELTRWAVHAADRVAIDAMATNLTPAEVTRHGVRAAIRMLLANALIEPYIPIEEVMIHMDPPDGWDPLPPSSIRPPS